MATGEKMNIDMEHYLDSSEYIDWKHTLVVVKAAELAEGCDSEEAVAKRCFEFVRDAIKHSWDYRMNPVICKASDVLYTAPVIVMPSVICWLRANPIPAGLCYQRLMIENDGPPYCLHGLNAVYLEQPWLVSH
jgi:hypothetical protein